MIIHDFRSDMFYNESGDLNVICYIWNGKVINGSTFTEIKETISM